MESHSEDSWLDGNEEPIQSKEPSEDEGPSEDEKTNEDEEPSKDKANFKQTLLERINEIQGTGSFAFNKYLASCPIPGICVDGGEPIAIPLSEEAAQDLARKSEKVPYGNHKETLVDVAARKTLQISAERIRFLNPEWDIFVNEAVQSVVHELGEDGSNVYAKFYKHILFEPGAMFKPHKDTEKDPGIFGTLVICLPSKHTGGTVCLQHGEETLKLSTAENSAYGYRCLAWHEDVTYEIEPVQTGYRWVLIYQLITNHKSSRASASVLHSQKIGLVNALSSWETQQYPPDFFIYVLDHQYTLENLRLSCLKGRDYQRASCLNNICNQHGKYYLFLAQLSIAESRSVHGPDQRFLHHVCSLQGFELSPLRVEIDKTSLLNSISRFQETHSDMVLVIVRAASLHAPLFDPTCPEAVERVMVRLREGINDKPKTMLEEILIGLCRAILDQRFPVNGVYFGHAAASAAVLRNGPLFEEARKKTLDLSYWRPTTWSTLGGAIDLQIPLTGVDYLFESLVKYSTLSKAYYALTAFYNGFLEYNIGRTDTTKAEYWKQWYSDQLIETLNICDRVDDGASMIDKIILGLEVQYTPEQREKVDEAVMKLVDKLTKAGEEVETVKDFVNALNIQLLQGLLDPKNARKEFFRSLFNHILELAISAFNFNRHSLYDGVIREFYKQTLAHNRDLAPKLLKQILDQAYVANTFAAKRVSWSLVEELSLVDTPSLEVQNWLEMFAEAYITKAAGKKPSEPKDWARPAEQSLWCDTRCQVCSELNLFIVDPNAEEITIALTGDGQEHATRKFPSLKTENGGRLSEVPSCSPETGNGDHLSEVRFTKTLEKWENRPRRWELRLEAAQEKLRQLPKLKQVLGDDKYNRLIGSTAQAADKAQLPLKRKGENMIDAGAGMTSKRVRRGGENHED